MCMTCEFATTLPKYIDFRFSETIFSSHEKVLTTPPQCIPLACTDKLTAKREMVLHISNIPKIYPFY